MVLLVEVAILPKTSTFEPTTMADTPPGSLGLGAVEDDVVVGCVGGAIACIIKPGLSNRVSLVTITTIVVLACSLPLPRELMMNPVCVSAVTIPGTFLHSPRAGRDPSPLRSVDERMCSVLVESIICTVGFIMPGEPGGGASASAVLALIRKASAEATVIVLV